MASTSVVIQDSAIVESRRASVSSSAISKKNSQVNVGASTSRIRDSSGQRSQTGQKSPRSNRRSRNRNRARTRSASSLVEDSNQRRQSSKQIKFGPAIVAANNRGVTSNSVNPKSLSSKNGGSNVSRSRTRSRTVSDASSIMDFFSSFSNSNRSASVSRNRTFKTGQKTNSNNKPTDYVSREIIDYYQRNRQSNEKYKSKQILRKSLENTLKQSFPAYFINLYIIGSSTNGIGDNASSVDICIMAKKKPSIAVPVVKRENETGTTNEKNGKQENNGGNSDEVVLAAADSNTEPFGGPDENVCLKHIEKILHTKNFAQNIILIPARVPVLKFKDVICDLNVTLNLNQEESIFNTQLIRDYTKMDWRFPYIAMIVKQWAAENRINSAVDKTISPYSWTLMVVHYLQTVEPPVLPCLQKIASRRYNASNLEDAANLWRQPLVHWQSRNTSNLKQLMKGFFRYFAYGFDYEQNIISVRQGKAVNRIFSSGAFDENAYQWNVLLCVEEPFNLTNTTRSVHDRESFNRIVDLLRIASNALKSNRISLYNIIINDLDFPKYVKV